MLRLKAMVATGTLVLVAVSGCAATGGTMTPTPTPTPSSGRPPFQTAGPMNPSGTPATPSADQLKAISVDLAGRGVTGELSVVKSVAITWSDGSLGCPEPGKFYTQALVPGMQVVVRVAGLQYDYHFGAGATPKLCAARK